MKNLIWLKAPFIFMSDCLFTEDGILVFKLFPTYLFFALTVVIGLVLWLRSGFDLNPGALVALPFASLLVSVIATYGLALWKRRKLSSPMTMDELSSRLKRPIEQIRWSEIELVALKNWQLSILAGGKTRNLFIRFSEAGKVEEFIRSKTGAPWSILKTRYYLLLVSLLLIIVDMALLVETSMSWSIFYVAAAIMAFSFALIIFAVLRPRIQIDEPVN